MCTTTLEVDGFEITRHLGIVRGITVRTRGALFQIAVGLRQMVGGRIGAYVELCEYAREEALQYMLTHAREHGANAVVGMRYDATELGPGITEVLAYGTAVVVQPKTG
ncbi:MAG: YbjQ family protein [Armatimonadetes bacterium]|nr:YbjQ family protein [Armatimonadota bacterium]MDE2207364.1 YbjQ family protein [Armatimonadota bacterium]